MATVPVSLAGSFQGSFAYFTIKDRLPQILTKVIDTLHRHKNEFFEEYGEVRVLANPGSHLKLMAKLPLISTGVVAGTKR
uniref:Uncharacterized protein n=1 Tax=Chelonoidis abingdonii TaxID=106734 RepID=A0A8C0H3V9_CHEAB